MHNPVKARTDSSIYNEASSGDYRVKMELVSNVSETLSVSVIRDLYDE
jgi:hypothetical protein